jgi:hypothetical protein
MLLYGILSIITICVLSILIYNIGYDVYLSYLRGQVNKESVVIVAILCILMISSLILFFSVFAF